MFRSLLTLVALVAGITPTLPSAYAWETGDAPAIAGRPSADLGGVYFFLDPNDNTFVILAATLRGFVVPSQNGNLGFFDPKVKLRFEIENSGDAKPDLYVDVKFGVRSAPADITQLVTVKTPSGVFIANTSPTNGAFGPQGPPTFGAGSSAQQFTVITTDAASGISFFGGLVDDPFFFDLGAVEAYRGSRLANMSNSAILTRGRDGFAGYNTMAVALRMPVAPLLGTGGSGLGLSVTAKGSGGAKDRAAHPFVNGLLIDYVNRDAYNAAKTAQDAAGKFADQITANMQALQMSSTAIDTLTALAVTNGDILRLNTTIPNTGTEGGKNPGAGYPNGRRPNDDVVDTILTYVNDSVFQGDAVNDNELPMRDTFPFFAKQIQPFPPGGGSEDLTRN